jgi:hypothetical protein
MTCVVQVGQAGNQVGEQLWRVLGDELERKGSGDMFVSNRDGSHRARW